MRPDQLDRTDPEGAIAATAARVSNWGRWGDDDVLGTMNFLTDAKRLSFTTADWLHATEIAAIATDTWGFEVRPNEFDHAFQPLHQIAIPHIGLFIGEM